MVFKKSVRAVHSGADAFFMINARQIFFLLLLFSARMAAKAGPADPWWPATTEQALAQAGTNRPALVMALAQTPAAHHEEMQFLIENAPETDLQTLSADFLLTNLTQADDVFANAAWHDQIPPDIFLNEILPYACVNETRDGWRAMLREKCAPLVADCQTPGEAALKINEKIFNLVNGHYSTARRKADQSPAESMVNGLASCTGLSILLVDACRSVGVPARLAGTPMWWDMRGNHTWVEVWDDGWHFIGASEPDPKGLDHAWFEHDASLAQPNVPLHAIYAASFKKTDLAFPLDWAPDIHWINAVNVTERYLPKTNSTAPGTIRLLVKVVEAGSGHRLAAKVSVDNITNSAAHLEGVSKDESADMNNVLAFELPAAGVYQIYATLGNGSAEQVFIPDTNAEQMVVLSLREYPPLAPRDEAKLKTALTELFHRDRRATGQLEIFQAAGKIIARDEPAVRQAAWDVFKNAPVHSDSEPDYAAKKVQFEDYTSPYTVKYVGTRREWLGLVYRDARRRWRSRRGQRQPVKIMQSHYKEHPEAGGYIYLALRAPNDTGTVFTMFTFIRSSPISSINLSFSATWIPTRFSSWAIRTAVTGRLRSGPKNRIFLRRFMPVPVGRTDGETTPVTLRNTIFTCMVGGWTRRRPPLARQTVSRRVHAPAR